MKGFRQLDYGQISVSTFVISLGSVFMMKKSYALSRLNNSMVIVIVDHI